MNVAEILNRPEGRRLEFKKEVPSGHGLMKTVIAFSNDAGGEIFIGIDDKSRKIIGIDSDKIISLEERISNMIFTNCEPVIIPEFTIHTFNNKNFLRLCIFKGNNPPYYLKSKGKEEGTYIRVGSSNRQASLEIISELERRSMNKSFDGEIFYEKEISEINIDSFRELFEKNTGEKLTVEVLHKLNLFKEINGIKHPSYSLILLSDDFIKNQMFPYSKIECARFKGNEPGMFIDQKTIDENISHQPDLALMFILRHISKGTIGYDGVYRRDRWEYPVDALREVVRNAVIHRDYSLSGKDIKIAIFDDKIEITSPGKLMPSVDYSQMEAGQSEIRNKIIAYAFKKMGIIEQWGNGLKIISNELKNYPEIEFQWSEPGIAFRVIFFNNKLNIKEKSGYDYGKDGIKDGIKDGLFSENEIKLYNLLRANPHITAEQASQKLGINLRNTEKNIQKLKIKGLIKRIGSRKTGHWEVV